MPVFRKRFEREPANQPPAFLARRVGALVGGYYRLEALLGHGGFAAVYRAKDERSVSSLAREQLTHFREVKQVTDVWAAAATFYNALTGAYPGR